MEFIKRILFSFVSVLLFCSALFAQQSEGTLFEIDSYITYRSNDLSSAVTKKGGDGMTVLVDLQKLNVLISTDKLTSLFYTFGRSSETQDNGDKDTYWMASDDNKNSYMVIFTEKASGGATLMVNLLGGEGKDSVGTMYYLIN